MKPRTVARGPGRPAGGGPKTFVINNAPIDEVLSVLVTKKRPRTSFAAWSRRAPTLANNSVTEILEVKQGHDLRRDDLWVRSGDQVDWAPGGPEHSRPRPIGDVPLPRPRGARRLTDTWIALGRRRRHDRPSCELQVEASADRPPLPQLGGEAST
ncbi:MAG: DUF4815 domain-containing protein [Devosia sp.]|nr:DUF4815 domain-containing protein [Devosia sp.]